MSKVAAKAARWKLYGLPLSQPFRSVAWAMLQNQIRFDVQLTVPGADNKVGSRNEAYKAKSRMRTTRVPLLEDTHSGFTVAESPAILSHLCEHYGWHESLYAPPASPKKATIDSYMHWHHTGTRRLSALSYPYLRPDMGESKDDEKDRARSVAILQDLEEGWFCKVSSAPDDVYLAGGTGPSIADLLAYEDVAQLTLMGLLKEDVLQTHCPKVLAWMHRMEQVPYYEDVHAALVALGDVTAETEVPLHKRLGAANKKGLQALNNAQLNFPEEPLQSKL